MPGANPKFDDVKAQPRADGKRVTMVDASGALVTVPESELGAAQRSGYTIATGADVAKTSIAEDRAKLAADPLTVAGAASAGALSGATFGLTNPLLAAASGADTMQEGGAAVAAMREDNALASGAGELVGALAPALLTGGTGAAGALARLTPAGRVAMWGTQAERSLLPAAQGLLGTVGGRAATGIITGAGEGAAYGLGQGAAEEIIRGDPNGAAARILYSTGINALYGGVGGGLASGGLAALERRTATIPGLAGKSVQQVAAETADFRARKAIAGNYERQMARMQEGSGTRLLEMGAPIQSPTKMVQWTSEQLATTGEQLRTIARAAEDAGAVVRASDLLSKVDEQVARLRSLDDQFQHGIADQLEDQVALIRKRVDAAGPTMKRSALAQQIDSASYSTGAKSALREAIETLPETTSPRAAVAAIESRVAAAAPEVAQELSQDLAAMRQYAASQPAGDVVYSVDEFWKMRTNFDRQWRDKITSLQRAGRTAEAGELQQLRGIYEDALQGAIERDGGSEAVAAWRSAKKDYAILSSAEAASKHLAAARDKNRSISLTDYLSGMTGITAALTTGSIGPALGGMALGAGNKLLREKGSAAMAYVAHAIATGDGRLSGLADRMLKMPRGLALSEATRAGKTNLLGQLSQKERDEQRKELAQLVRDDPEQFAARVQSATQDLNDISPEIAAAAFAQLHRHGEVLAAALPPRQQRQSLTPMASQVPPTPEQQMRFERVADVLEDPDVALESLADGSADWDQLMAIKQAMPEVVDDLRTKVLERAPLMEKELDFAQRIQLGLFLDLPQADASLDPQYAAAMQLPPPRESEFKPPRPTSTTGEIGADYSTKSDTLESR